MRRRCIMMVLADRSEYFLYRFIHSAPSMQDDEIVRKLER